MLLGWWLEFVVVQKRGQLEILHRVQGGGSQNGLERFRRLVVLLECGVQELARSHQDLLRPPSVGGLFHIRAKPAMLPLVQVFGRRRDEPFQN